jgi:hypothetical protein
LAAVRGSSPAFADCRQADAALDLTLNGCLPAYRAHHEDLLFHLAPADFEASYLLGHMFEAVLRQGEPWDERGRIISGAVTELNDFVGYRPIAVLENGRRMELYEHERFHCVPVYLQGAGVSSGPHQPVIEATLAFLREAPGDLLRAADFFLDHLEELAVDVRAYDHTHPVTKRTNYIFGEWDPHRIALKGWYTRFVVREIVLSALIRWVEEEQPDVPKEERLFDAAAALSGTMLMASAVSGSEPATHDSTTSLTKLLPVIARHRDTFYERLMAKSTGERRQRLEREAERTHQPFGHIRQYLNMTVAGHAARQVQHREIAVLYARMGYGEASRQQALVIPSASARFECDINCRVGSARVSASAGDVAEAAAHLAAAEDLLHRGIACGALPDPWNILGFHGQFPLFQAREDAIPDPRIETLMYLMEEHFAAYTQCLTEASAQGATQLRSDVSRRFLELAEWWDRYGSDIIEDLPDVSGHESWESATHVATALAEWQSAGQARGDISFWKQRVQRFPSAQAYAQVVNVLLARQDLVAAMGLLMQWLSQIDELGCESPRDSLFGMLIRWMKLLIQTQADHPADLLTAMQRLFDYLEANAGEFWGVPTLDVATEAGAGESALRESDVWEDADASADQSDDEDNILGAAYEHVTFRDSADDGNWNDTLDEGADPQDTEFELLNRSLEPRIKFLNAITQMWQMAAVALAPRLSQFTAETDRITLRTGLAGWLTHVQRWQRDLRGLMRDLWQHEIPVSSGDQDANLDYDMQWQVKLYLMHQVIMTIIGCRHAERLLQSCLPANDDLLPSEETERQTVALLGAVIRGEAVTAARLLPAWIAHIKQGQPLLYVPLDHSGSPPSVLNIQLVQTTLRFLLASLPRQGLLRATYHLLQTVFTMERASRPSGPAITEFDRAFQLALRRSLEALIHSASQADNDLQGESLDELLIDLIQQALTPYHALWLRHSETMRLSAIDLENTPRGIDLEIVADFIRKYGGDLLHASQLTLGNVRAILRMGVGNYLDYLAREVDPLHEITLIADLQAGRYRRSQAESCLEFLYSVVVDKFDRFVEYNTTTTQSDYGEKFNCLLDFLRLEARYDRDAWNLIPFTVAHEVLARAGHDEAARLWEQLCGEHTAARADKLLREYRTLAQTHGMRMPVIADHLHDRFVRPLAVNRMVALVQQAMGTPREADRDPATFARLQAEIDEYLKDSWGSGIDVPEWLQNLGHEVERADLDASGGRPGPLADIDLPQTQLSAANLRRELESLTKPLRRSASRSNSRTQPSPGRPPRSTPRPADGDRTPRDEER